MKNEPDYYIIPNDIANEIDGLATILEKQYLEELKILRKKNPNKSDKDLRETLNQSDIGYYNKLLDKHSFILLETDIAFRTRKSKKEIFSRSDKINYYNKRLFDEKLTNHQRSYARKRLKELW